jgi:hypothetical protein
VTSAWNNQPALKIAAVMEITGHRASGTLSRRRDSPVQVGTNDRFQGGFHVCLTARRLAQERNIPVSALLADGETAVRWLDESERLWGIPQVVGGLLDRCFERVPAAEAADFAVTAIEAIPVGADLDQVPTRWMLDLLADDEGGGVNGVLARTVTGSPQHAAVERVVELFRRKLTGDSIAIGEWQVAALAAQTASAQANTIERAGSAATASATAYAAAAAYAPDVLPQEARVAAWRASVTLSDEAAATAYQATYMETEALAQAAEYAVNTVEAAADTAFQMVFAPIREAAQRARAAERSGQIVNSADAAAAEQARHAAEAATATCVKHNRWRARRLIQHLTQAPKG